MTHVVIWEPTWLPWKQPKSGTKRKASSLKSNKAGSYTHYHIGLRKESETWKWTDAGSPGVTVATDDSRWQENQPTADRDPREVCGEIWYPSAGLEGFNDILCDYKFQAEGRSLPRGYICEND